MVLGICKYNKEIEMMSCQQIITMMFLSVFTLVSCKTEKNNEIYEDLKEIAKEEYERANRSYERYQMSYREKIRIKISNLSIKELTELFAEFSEHQELIGSFVAMNLIVLELGEAKSQEGAKELLNIYQEYRSFFDGEAALNFRCSFKRLGKVGLVELQEKNRTGDLFLQEIQEMIKNNTPCL